MSTYNKIIENEIENCLDQITWDDVLTAIAALNNNEQELIISDIKGNNGSARQVLFKQIKQIIRTKVKSQVDKYVSDGSMPIDFIYRAIK